MKISDYKIIRGHRIDLFEGEINEAISQGWQPLNMHGFESSDDFNYIIEMVKYVEDDVYEDMVDFFERDSPVPPTNHEPIEPEMMQAVRRVLREVNWGEDTRVQNSPPPDPHFDDELFNNE